MASNKNQHFVPRCYLRPFTVDGAGSAINLYNIDRKKLIRMAPAKSQCSGDYFYGKDDRLEAAIQTLEGEYATVLRAILKPAHQLIDQHRHILKLFWLFQYLRTEAASRRALEMSEGIRLTAGIDDISYCLEIREAVQIAMKTFADSMGAVSDLKVCLFRNKTQIPFITSDDPAVLTNRWYLQNLKARGMSFGLAAAGNITILPLSPRVLCLGYDGGVHSVPHKGGWVEVRRESDVEALNQHQFLNCRANIFVKDPTHAGVVHKSFLKAAPLRLAVRHRVNYAIRDGFEGDCVRYSVVDSAESRDNQQALIHTQTLHPTPSQWPQQLLWRGKGTLFTNGSGVGYVREQFAAAGPGATYWRERARSS